MNTTHNYFLAVDGDIPFLFRSFLKGVFWLGWVNEWMKWVGVWVQIKWEMGMPYHGCWVASNLTSKFLPQPHFNLSLGRHGNYRWRRGAIGKILNYQFSLTFVPLLLYLLMMKKPQVSGLLAHIPEKSSWEKHFPKMCYKFTIPRVPWELR